MKMSEQAKIKRLRKQMDEMKQEMEYVAKIYGMEHEETLLASQRVDRIHNELNRLIYGRK